MLRKILIISAITVVAAAAVILLGFQFNLSALPEPGHLETTLAAKAKRVLVAHASRHGIPPEPAAALHDLEEGDKLFGGECAMCHGRDGRSLTDNGRWMYPRAADLGSSAVQEYSNTELFWIIKNGIRLSGMPAFGRVETDEHIWQLTHYVRSLGKS
jgi:mono/diheme cytochrome c family protein